MSCCGLTDTKFGCFIKPEVVMRRRKFSREFKAHQQRFIKERQDYAASEVKRMSASRQ